MKELTKDDARILVGRVVATMFELPRVKSENERLRQLVRDAGECGAIDALKDYVKELDIRDGLPADWT